MIVEFFQKDEERYFRLENVEEIFHCEATNEWICTINNSGEIKTKHFSFWNYDFIKCERDDLHISMDIIKNEVRNVLNNCICGYADKLVDCDGFILAIRSDVEETSAWKNDGSYNNDDIKFAIGRILCNKYGIEY